MSASPTENADASEDGDSLLNPVSTSFDPLAALNAACVPGLPQVEPLRNLQQFEEYQANPDSFLKAQAEQLEKQNLKKAAKQRAEEASVSRAAEIAATTRPQNTKNVLTRMGYKDGPSQLLNRWVQSRTRVKVITRSFKSIRGTCTGFVVAFDKYFNLAMIDVDETYSSLWTEKEEDKKFRGKYHKALRSERKSREIMANDEARMQNPEIELITKRVESLKLTPANNIKHRHMRQVFVRGDSVVSINACV